MIKDNTEILSKDNLFKDNVISINHKDIKSSDNLLVQIFESDKQDKSYFCYFNYQDKISELRSMIGYIKQVPSSKIRIEDPINFKYMKDEDKIKDGSSLKTGRNPYSRIQYVYSFTTIPDKVYLHGDDRGNRSLIQWMLGVSTDTPIKEIIEEIARHYKVSPEKVNVNIGDQEGVDMKYVRDIPSIYMLEFVIKGVGSWWKDYYK